MVKIIDGKVVGEDKNKAKKEGKISKAIKSIIKKDDKKEEAKD